MTTQVRTYANEDRDAVLAVIEEVWGSTARKVHEFLWDWKQQRCIDAPVEGQKPWVVNGNGGVAGYTGSMPAEFKINGERYPGIYCMDTFVHPGARGAGIRLMKNQLQQIPVLVGIAVPRAKQLWTRLVGRDDMVIHDLTRLVFIRKPVVLLQGKSWPGIAKMLVRMLWPTYIGLRQYLEGMDTHEPYTIDSVEHFPKEIDGVWSAFSSRFTNCPVRDSDYLNWRFHGCPVGYQIRLLRYERRIVGYSVYRTATIRNRRVLLLIEIVAVEKEEKHYRMLLTEMHEYARKQDVEDIQSIRSGCAILERVQLSIGYLPRNENDGILGVFKMSREKRCPMYRKNSWYLSAADGDLEFVVFDQYNHLDVHNG